MDPIVAFMMYFLQEELRLLHFYNRYVMEHNAKLLAETAELKANLEQVRGLNPCKCDCCNNDMDTS